MAIRINHLGVIIPVISTEFTSNACKVICKLYQNKTAQEAAPIREVVVFSMRWTFGDREFSKKSSFTCLSLASTKGTLKKTRYRMEYSLRLTTQTVGLLKKYLMATS